MCSEDAGPREPGHCGGSSLASEASKPTPTEGWGWCGPDCEQMGSSGNSATAATYLQTVRLQILAGENCKELGKGLDVDFDKEICAARKVHVLEPKRLLELLGAILYKYT